MSEPALSEVERGLRRGAFENIGCAMHTFNLRKVPYTFNSPVNSKKSRPASFYGFVAGNLDKADTLMMFSEFSRIRQL